MADVFERNRAILCHFDSYSALLLFARFGRTLLAPEAAPEGAAPLASATPGPEHDPGAVRDALAARYGLNAEELQHQARFSAWLDGPSGPVRVHLFRVKTFSPPKDELAAHEGTWKPVSELRGVAKPELDYARTVFNLIMGG